MSEVHIKVSNQVQVSVAENCLKNGMLGLDFVFICAELIIEYLYQLLNERGFD